METDSSLARRLEALERENAGLRRAISLVRSVSLPPDADNRIALAFRGLSTIRSGRQNTAGGLLDLATGIASPLRGRRGVQGVLYADNRFTGRVIDDVTAMVFQLVADHAGRAIENARSYEDVARAARTDALTGLGHHGALLGALSDAVLEARRSSEPLSVAMIDLDDFKSINDTRGHLAGDRLLAEAAQRLRQTARAGSVFRYGGEEFTVLLPGADAVAAVTASERLRQIVSETPFDLDDGPSVHLTCSIGVATLWDAASPDGLLQAADQALLQAKRSGKNRVVTAF